MPDYKAKRGYDELFADRASIFDAPHYKAQVLAIVDAVADALRRGNTIYWCGNGGSAAEAQHMSAELSGRYLRERPGYASEALSVNTSTLTAVGNDYGYDHVFARQVQAFGRPGDVLIGLTTSGGSRNLVLAFEEARKRGVTTVAFTGNGGGALAGVADLVLLGPDGYSAMVQEVHQRMAHIVCDLVEQRLMFGA